MKKLSNATITIETDEVVANKILEFINTLSNEDKKEVKLTYSSTQIFVEDSVKEKKFLKD